MDRGSEKNARQPKLPNRDDEKRFLGTVASGREKDASPSMLPRRDGEGNPQMERIVATRKQEKAAESRSGRKSRKRSRRRRKPKKETTRRTEKHSVKQV